MLTNRQLQTLRNMGNEAEEAADEIENLRADLANARGARDFALAAAREAQEIARMAQAATPAQAQQAGFDAWWESEGQFCRAGGGDYERSFAWAAWRATKAEAQAPLTDEQIVDLLYPIYDGLPSLTPITDTKVARATEAACAEAWGVKLAGIGASTGSGNG